MQETTKRIITHYASLWAHVDENEELVKALSLVYKTFQRYCIDYGTMSALLVGMGFVVSRKKIQRLVLQIEEEIRKENNVKRPYNGKFM